MAINTAAQPEVMLPHLCDQCERLAYGPCRNCEDRLKEAMVKIEMQDRRGVWYPVPDALSRVFDHAERTLALMQAFDTGWTGITFPLHWQGREYRCRVYSSGEHVVDVTESFSLTLEG